MEKEKFLEPQPETTSVIDEPHFEEAWTVLAARPVVPLQQVEARQGVRGTLKLIAAFLGAGLLGVIVGLASIRFRQLPATSTANEVPVPNDSTQNAEDQPSTLEQTAIEPEVEAAPVKTPSRVTETAKRQPSQTAAPEQSGPGTESDLSSSQPQLIDEWQERRPRRTRIRRERHEPDDLHHRDLLRIQEIFEGRRPRNP
jgi:hypothetical protein